MYGTDKFEKMDGTFGKQTQSENFKEFDATHLYCSRCKQAVPVRKRLLIVLPEGDKYEYTCAFCSQSVGTKIDKNKNPLIVL